MGDPKLGKLRGRHSLEAWGVRLGMSKVGADLEDFSKWTPELQARCAGDVAICKRLWQFLQPDGYSQQALELEHRVAPICDRITADGVPFDRAAAEQLYRQWSNKQAGLKAKLQDKFPGTNLNSHQQIGRLLEARGWIPTKRTEKTKQPVIDDDVLARIPALFPEFTGLAEYELLRRRIAQLATGKQAWLKNIGDDGCVHSTLIHIGTPHGRAKHLAPNIAQVPNAKKGGAYAAECRALFRHPNDWAFVTCDQANLQDRAFAHHLAEFDGGAYAKDFLAGVDKHWQNATALELIPTGTERDKDSKFHTAIREGAKTFRYGFLFGAGVTQCGEILTETVRTLRNIEPSYTAPTNGKRARDRFIAATPGLQHLRNKLEAQVNRHQWQLGLDGRRVPTRALYTALNYALASIEAIVCKRWLANLYDELRARFQYGWKGDVVIALWVHDEIAACCKPKIAEQVGEILVRHAKKAGEHYQLNVPLDAEFKIGRSWAGESVEPLSPANTGANDDDFDRGDDDDEGGELEPNPDFDRAGVTSEDRLLWEMPSSEFVAFAAVCDGGTNSETEDRHTGNGHTGNGSGGEKRVGTANGTDRCATNGSSAGGGNGYGGRSNKILCPFHDDHTPSLEIYPGEDDPHYHCYVCGAHGHLDDLPVEPALIPAGGQSAADDARNLAWARELWSEAKPIAGTLAERYLVEVRRIDVGTLPPHSSEVLRFHSHCPFGRGIRTPCLIALYRDVETDEPAGIHRIALPPEVFAGGKVERRTLGRWRTPRAIKLWTLSASNKHLYFGEGIESVLGAATHVKDRGALMQPAWAAGSSGNVSKLPVIPDVIELNLLVDHGAAGEKTTAACRQAWIAAGRSVRRLRTRDARYNDFNDLVLKTEPADWGNGFEEIKETTNPAEAAGNASPEHSWPILAPEAYYGLAGQVVAALKPHTESDPVALLMQYLVYAGNCIGRVPYYQVESTRHYPNLFTILVGATAKARKGTAAERIRRIFEVIDQEWACTRIHGGMSSGEGVIHAVRDSAYGTGKKAGEVVDPGIADKRLLLDEREFYQALAVMQREGSILSRVIRDAWDCREILATLTKHSPTKATQALISVVGHITAEELRETIDHTSIANGYCNRFLFACVRRSGKLLPFGAIDVDLSGLAGETHAAINAARNVQQVKWTDGAASMWEAVYAELSKDTPGMLGAITARAEAQTVRLAMLYALLDQSRNIRRRHLRPALALWNFCDASARFIFGDLLGDPIADAILRALRQSPAGLSRTSIRDLFDRNASADKIQMALLKLLNLGKARKETPAPQKPGRPVEMWFAV